MSEPTNPEEREERHSAELALLGRLKEIGGLVAGLLGICVVLGGFAVFVLGQAQAQQKPIEVRVSFVEQQQIFSLKEQREGREDTRAIGKRLEALTGERIPAINRPMAPLPLLPDGGR